MIGPVKIQHQLSNVALGRIQAWAHHMWTTIQQQKERIVQLQTQLRQLQNQAAEQKALPASAEATPPAALTTAALDAPQPPTSTNVSPEMWQWVLTRLENAEQEQAQLKAQIAQLQGQSQSASLPVQAPQPVQPALQGTGVQPEMQTELIKWREESRALQYQQSEQWRTIFEHFRYNTQQALAEHEPKLHGLLEPLKTQLASQAQAIAHLKSQLQDGQVPTEAALQDQLSPLKGQIEAQQQTIAALETQLQASQTQAIEQLSTQIQGIQVQSDGALQGAIAPLAEQLQHLQTTQHDLATLPEQLQSLQDRVEQQQMLTPPLEQAIDNLTTQVQTLNQTQAQQAQSVQQLTAHTAQLQQTQDQTTQLISPTEIRATLDSLQAQLQELRTLQAQTVNLPQDLKSLELTIQQHIQATEPASLAWQRQKNEILAKIDRFDTICGQFQALESTVAQLQKALHTLTPPSTVSARHTNTVYTRYQQ